MKGLNVALLFVVVALVSSPSWATASTLTCPPGTQPPNRCENSCTQNQCGRNQTGIVCATVCDDDLCMCEERSEWLDVASNTCYASANDCPTVGTAVTCPEPTVSGVRCENSCNQDRCGRVTSDFCNDDCDAEICMCPEDGQWLDVASNECYASADECPTASSPTWSPTWGIIIGDPSPTQGPTRATTDTPTSNPTASPTSSPSSTPTVTTKSPTTSTPTASPTAETTIGADEITNPPTTPTPTRTITIAPTTRAQFEAGNGSKNAPTQAPQQQCEDKSLNIFHAISLGVSGMLCVVLVVSMCVLQYYRELSVLKLSVMPALQYVMLGLLLFCASVWPRTLASIQPEDTTDLCLASRWLQDIGYVMAVAPMILKAYSVRRIFFNPTLQKLKMRPNDIHKGVFALIVIMVIVLTLWTVFSAPRVTLPECVCKSRELPYFLISLFYQGLLTLYGLHWATKTKHLGAVLSESKAIFDTLLNCLGSMLLVGLLNALQYLVPDEIELQNGLETLLVTLVIAQVTVFVAYKMLKPRYDKRNFTFNQLVDEAVASLREFEKKRDDRKSQRQEAKAARTSATAAATRTSIASVDDLNDTTNGNGQSGDGGLGGMAKGVSVSVLKARQSSGKDDSSVDVQGSSWNSSRSGMPQATANRQRNSSLDDLTLDDVDTGLNHGSCRDVDTGLNDASSGDEVTPMSMSLSTRSPSHRDLTGVTIAPLAEGEEGDVMHADDVSLDMSGEAMRSHSLSEDGDDDNEDEVALEIV